MRLSRIEIENFKGIGTTQTIDLKPITLLFGPNSAGKSTILQSLHYLREILERRNIDPDQTIAGGLMDFGGYATLVHGHDLNRSIKIKVSIDLSSDQGNERLPLNLGNAINDPDFNNLNLIYFLGANTGLQHFRPVQEIALEVEISWSDLIQSPYISRLGVEMDGSNIAEIRSPPQAGRAQLTAFNFSHPLLQKIINPDDAVELDDAQISDLEIDHDSEIYGDPFSTSLGNEIWELSREMSASSSHHQQDEFRIAVETLIGALPDLDRTLTLDLVDIDESLNPYFSDTSTEYKVERHRRVGLTNLLDEIMIGPMRIVRDYLRSMTYVGPLREIPSRNYRPRLSLDESRWAQGLAAWDLLYTDKSEKFLTEVNAWLSGSERLKTGYRLENFQFKEIPIPGRFNQIFERGLNEEDLGELQELYSTLSCRSEIALRDFETGIIVAPGDVGVGISQMIPVIVGCLRNQTGILAIEQPELHIHPAVQVGIGDLFIRSIQLQENSIDSPKTLLIETHSEHIMLRLLRRIRETTENELPPGIIGLTPDDLSVVYVESGKTGVQFKRLHVAHDGEFIDRWPKGFFEERTEELF